MGYIIKWRDDSVYGYIIHGLIRYLYFPDLKLYYAHGRWYNPNTALWLSPDEKGEYVYCSGQDAVNWYVGQFWANAQWGYQQFQRASQATVEPLIAAGKSSPEAKAVVLGAGQFVADTAMASHYAMLPARNWTLQDRIGNAARATIPVVTIEGIVWVGIPVAVQAGKSVLGPVLAAKSAIDQAPRVAEPMTRLYRAVSEAEFQDLLNSGTFRIGPNSLAGKWFALTIEDAQKWGEVMAEQFGGGGFRVVAADVPTDLYESLFSLSHLDNIGPAVYVDLDKLSRIIFLGGVR